MQVIYQKKTRNNKAGSCEGSGECPVNNDKSVLVKELYGEMWCCQ